MFRTAISGAAQLEELRKIAAKILREQVKLNAEHGTLQLEADLRMDTIEQMQWEMEWEMEKRFGDRCRRIEETQKKIEKRFDEEKEEAQRKILQVRVSYPRRQCNTLIFNLRL